MPTPNPHAADRFLHTHFAALLASSARALGVGLHVWSDRVHLMHAVPQPLEEDLHSLRAVAGRAAAHHCLIREVSIEGRRYLAVPVLGRDGLTAVLSMVGPAASSPAREIDTARPETGHGERPDPALAFLEDLARVLAHHLDLAAESAGSIGMLDDSRDRLNLLDQIAGLLTRGGDLRATLGFILEECRRAAGADHALLALPGRRMLLAVPKLKSDSPTASGEVLTRRLCGQLLERSRSWARPGREGDVARLLSLRSAALHGARLAAARLGPAAGPEGILCLLKTGGRPFRRSPLGLVESLSRQVALTLWSADLQNGREDFLLATVRALVSTIEAKDRYTSGHSTRVHLLSMLLGKDLDLAAEELGSLKWASLLHDVGKIGMPESILNKPGRLTDAEFEVVKQHSQRGYQVLNHIPQLQEASQAVLLHHERYAGGGYPLGIAGEGIPRAARIIAVADTFDALTSRRPYRDARNQDEALVEIRRVRGTQLDPMVVGALEGVMPFLRENLVMEERVTAHPEAEGISSVIGK
ncbi:MAG: HD-GYP domain-containing protein [Candidatus Eisenbacteria bacterium]